MGPVKNVATIAKKTEQNDLATTLEPRYNDPRYKRYSQYNDEYNSMSRQQLQ